MPPKRSSQRMQLKKTTPKEFGARYMLTHVKRISATKHSLHTMSPKKQNKIICLQTKLKQLLTSSRQHTGPRSAHKSPRSYKSKLVKERDNYKDKVDVLLRCTPVSVVGQL
ncbi:uncharacterized protein LOC143038863 [Oratosquilla oratoria]|uniref:uncharacterized protein LOC143038863 n=1 Tax=Oratosquilla oratoria TaxID=337810 RepID=UPI003F75FF7A